MLAERGGDLNADQSVTALDQAVSEYIRPIRDASPRAPLEDVVAPCEQSDERCDGVDKDCDGEVDETHWPYDPLASGLALHFS